jgi:hypothetical protein
MIMPGTKLEEIACGTFGARWTSILAKLWGVSRQTVFNMGKSQRGHTSETKLALLEALRSKWAQIGEWINELEEDLGL